MTGLRSDMSSREERLTTRITSLEETLRRNSAMRDGESRHFAQSIGVLERDVATLKNR
ncbi:MAG TPA: hypothetical protein VNT01_13420 [Symbiobacteriaceae bacterium]|nr:hypothetical protein [Symbiobacteriaceae bacterium]